ncbi:hypothetical protein [uncultured Aquimarina sp.]|uniref:hypothetical protein n=1 Tax=uncultured Aquimarina sp. TaxID=575652 RepID=UPI0026167209|nr:hypothetical protein [uncultured Aquimarina sp.]
MKKRKIVLFIFIFINCFYTKAQDKDYIEFNDRNNILHGVYLGGEMAAGFIKKNATISSGMKLAYVYNKKMELGIAVKALASDLRSVDRSFGADYDLLVIYGGLHSENILIRSSNFNFSFPFLIGLGYTQISGPISTSEDITLVVEPGFGVLYNLSKYIQFEAAIKYRFSTPIDPIPNTLDNINGVSLNIGTKIGVFNLGKNRYKKNPPKD